MSWRGTGAQARAVAERRLLEVAHQWRPAPAPAPADPWVEPAAARRPRLGAWRWPALRGLALLLGLVLAIVAYGVWSSRPRAVVAAPTVLAAGVSLPVPEPVAPTPQPESSAPEMAAPAVPAPEVVVHVTGQVARTGLVRLPAGSRVADAIDAAGGVTKPRAADTVNLARVLVDGEQVVVGGPPGAPAAPAPAASPALVDLNAATVDALDSLPGVGPVIAGRIVAWREANGPFRSVDELGEVSGIGESILAQVRALVRV